MPSTVNPATTYDRSEIGGGADPNNPAGMRFADTAGDTAERYFEVRWQINAVQWGTPRQYSLGARGDYDPTVLIEQIGVFDTIKFEFVIADSAQFELSMAELEVEVLDVASAATGTTNE